MTATARSLDPWRYALAEWAEPEDDDPDPQPGLVAAYAYRPADFARTMIRWPAGGRLEDYQAEALELLAKERRLVVRGPHGLGKTTVEALAILWFAITREALGTDWKVPTTAGVGRQLSVYLWPEVHKWARRLRWDLIGMPAWREGRELLDQAIKLHHGEAFAATVNDAAAIEGAHARSLLFVFTEAKAIDSSVFDAAEGAFSGAGPDTADEAFALVQSTPGAPEGRFYDLCRRAAGTEDWTFRRVTKAQVIAAGRMSAEWAEARREQWGEGSAVYQNRVEGEFAVAEENGVIPLAWVEAATARWQDAYGVHGDAWAPAADFTAVGADIARSGEDRTVLARRYGTTVAPLEREPFTTDTMVPAGRLLGILNAHGGAAIVDVIGVGAGVVDRLREQEPLGRVVAFNASERTDRTDRSGELGFVNKRAAAWWNMRELLDPNSDSDPVALPPDDLLTGDLLAPHWKVMSGGKVQIESKDDIRKRLGRSTDSGDAVVQSFWPTFSEMTMDTTTAGMSLPSILGAR